MPKYTEDDLKEAINAIQNGVSIRQASKDWGVPKTTLQDRIKGAQPKGLYESQVQQKLSVEQEKHLARWIITQEALGLPVTHNQIQLFANRVLEAGGSRQTVGQRWVRNLIHRNPELKTKRGRSTDVLQVNRATSDIIKVWFKKLNLPEVHKIPQKD